MENLFKRIAVDDCLVNDGRALSPGAALLQTRQHQPQVIKFYAFSSALLLVKHYSLLLFNNSLFNVIES